LENQSEKNFEWVVFVHENLPKIFLNQVYLISDKSNLNISVVKVKDYGCIGAEIDGLLNNCDSDVVLTSRIDDDDLLIEDAIHEIQSHVSKINDVETVVVGFKNGMEFIPGDRVMRPINHQTIALGLSMISKRSDGRFDHINQYAHHVVLETLKKRNKNFLPVLIERELPLYLYTKHLLSDSYFFGSRARVLNSPERVSFDSFSKFYKFGLSQETLKYLTKICNEMPLGMPHKYMEKLGTIRNQIKVIDLDVEFNEKLLRNLIAKKKRYEEHACRPNPYKNRKGKLKVAVVGSCVSRDIFEIEKELLKDFDISFYSARSSIISYMSTPNVDKKIVISEEGFEAKRAVFDLSKEHWIKLEQSNPDLILVDFIDERIGLIQHMGGTYSASGPVINAFEKVYGDIEVLRPWSTEVMELRSWAIKPFMEKVYSICPNIFIHKASWANEYFCENRTKRSFDGSRFETLIDLNNKVLNELFKALDEISTVPFEYIGGGNHMLSSSEHKWGFSPIHYDKSYVRSVAGQIAVRAL
jgi:hypothetical protein